MSGVFNNLIQDIKKSDEKLIDIVGHYLFFDDEYNSVMPAAISLVFNKKTLLLKRRTTIVLSFMMLKDGSQKKTYRMYQ